MSPTIDISESLLRRLYLEDGLTQNEIAAHVGCGVWVVQELMRKWEIETRHGSVYRRIDLPRNELYEMYIVQRMSLEAIADYYGCGLRTVRRRIKAFEIETRHGSEYRFIELPRDELDNLYTVQGLGAETIAARYGCSNQTVLRRLRDFNIPVRPCRVSQYVPPEVYGVWTSDLAYAVGLIASDGNLDKRGSAVRFASTDEELIDLYCGCLQLSVDVPNYVAPQRGWGLKPVHYVDFDDRGFRTFLEDIGLTPAKSKTIGPLAIPDNVFADFLRGCWDGDGCWSIHRDNRWPSVEYLRTLLASASPIFLVWVQATVKRLTGLASSISHVNLEYSGKYAVQLGEWLYYAPAVPALGRKRAIWEKFAAQGK